ncbi:methionyl-tRNA formyltransferase [Desulfurobacterium pacificum]|uniref:Methionyl-tRNA formyltransferase n=2 Tax=Desulfurobacterium pacificum TaxID=240166 RepID=A0ABY1NKR0_9BACT|nr:methionyl-tRNA formyltransferase [Desulfurobacterium pacificum]SMP11333.1 methionyl-tRNA formyltransferase [Desulfurobacterium pacificum]
MKEKMVFMGTPDFAVPSLKALIDKGFNVSLVVTQPDKPAGRGKKLTPPPVKVVAEKNGIPVVQPEKIKNNEEFKKLLEDISPDLIVVVAYGKILPSWLLNLPRYGCINLHASLLPEYRGASPIQSALLDGKEKTGVTVMKISEELDAGDILSQRVVPIEKNDNAETLHDKLAKVGAELLVETIPLYIKGEIKPTAQEHSKATYCTRITKEMGKIDWNEPAEKIFNKVRAFTPWPSAYTTFNGKRLKIIQAEPVDCSFSASPGTVVKADKELIVSTGKGCLKILRLKPEGRKEISAEEFLRGYPIKTGDKLK